jgi:hypothetical protein
MTRPLGTAPALAPALAVALAALPLAAAAQNGIDGPGDVAAGADHYALFCASCHGGGGRGDGPTAEVLTLQPTDLTRLAAENDGSFPTATVVRQIDGRDPVLGHGRPMPLYGPFFAGEDVAIKTPAGQPVLTSRPVADLVAWLQTIQR